jgi:hypothetical protein
VTFKEKANTIKAEKERAALYAKRAQTVNERKSESPLEQVVRLWPSPGNQCTNNLCVIIAGLFQGGSKPADIAQHVRNSKLFHGTGFSGVGKNDPIYQAILKTLGCMKGQFDAGLWNHLLMPGAKLEEMDVKQRTQQVSECTFSC